MLPMSLAELAKVVEGTMHLIPDPEATISGPAVVDSREACAGSFFAAFDGESVDGHCYAADAVARGATCALVSRPVEAPSIVVPDVLKGLSAIANFTALNLPKITRIGITGSCGKTSTKDALAQVLSRLGATVATEGNRNNELGVPLTVLGAQPGVRYLVLEMGARGIGHLAHLTNIVPLDVAVVLNVGYAHAGEFGNLEATAQAKGELVESLRPDGVAVLNADDPRVSAMSARCVGRVVLFGTSDQAQIRADDIYLDHDGTPRFELSTPDGRASVTLRQIGQHQVWNALAVAATAYAIGMPTSQIADALSGVAAAAEGRLERHERADGVTIVDDAYNANPDSVRVALQTLAAIGLGRRKVAVLGEMRELGDDSAAEHRAIGETAARLGVEVVVGVGGAEASQIIEGARAFGTETHLVPNPQAAAELLQGLLQSGDVVVVKASKAAGLRVLAQDLIANPGGPGAAPKTLKASITQP